MKLQKIVLGKVFFSWNGERWDDGLHLGMFIKILEWFLAIACTGNHRKLQALLVKIKEVKLKRG